MFVKLKFRSCPKAIALIKETNGTQIKDKAVMEKLMEYLRRNKPYIPCYAIRKQLGLGNSSNIYIMGYYAGTTDLDPGPGNLALTTEGSWDIYLIKVDGNGDLIR